VSAGPPPSAREAGEVPRPGRHGVEKVPVRHLFVWVAFIALVWAVIIAVAIAARWWLL
jgi:hypothetical protein